MRLTALCCLLALAFAPVPAEEGQPRVGRSAALVTRSLGEGGAAFAAQLGPRLAARASAGGVAVAAAEPAGDERQQILAARSRGATLLVEAKVTSLAATSATLLGEERRRMSASLSWRVLDIAGDTDLVGSGEASESSLADTVVGAEEQAAGLAGSLAEKAGAQIAARLAGARPAVVARLPVPVRVLADGLSLPALTVGPDFRVARGKEELPLEMAGFTLTCDGVVVGTVPSERAPELPKGLREVTLSRGGFETWTARVDVREGLRLEPAIRPTAEGLARWRDQVAFLRGLEDGARLTEAEAERVRGAAAMLRNSGFRTNIDVKVDAKELPETVVAPAR